MPLHTPRDVLLGYTMFTLLSTLCAAEQCGWEERAGIMLKELLEPAMVLREYSDVTSAMDCYQKCCELKNEDCNVASFMTYKEDLICVNVRCEPFDNCIWGPYTTSIAAIIARPANNISHTFSHAIVSGVNSSSNYSNKNVKNNHTNATSPGSNVAASSSTGTLHNAVNNTFVVTANYQESSKVINGAELTEVHANIKPITQATHSFATFIKPESKDHSKPFYPDYNSDTLNKNTTIKRGDGDNVSKDQHLFSDNGNLVGKRNITLYMDGVSSQMNYAVSITVGVLTCIIFLVVMYIAARRFDLFKDRSKYNRLLENSEQYADNSHAEFRD